MRTLADLLPDYSAPTPRARPEGADPAEVVAREERAYEQGFRAGWDDAMRARAEDEARIGDEFAQNLKDLSFTYHEAYTHVLRAMGPLLDEIVETIVPAALDDALAAHLVSTLSARAAELGGLGVEVAVAPEQIARVEPLIARDVGFPVDLVADGSLGEGQADIRLADREERIDLTDIAEGIRTAVAGLHHMNEGQFAHG